MNNFNNQGVRALKRYEFKNEQLNSKLHLYWGRCIDETGRPYSSINACRWTIICSKNPLPVRSGTWFSGFSSHIMIEWLNEYGWELEYIADLETGRTEYYLKNLNENSASIRYRNNKIVVKETIKYLLKNNEVVRAVRLYRAFYDCSIRDARDEIDKIREEIENET